MPKSAGDRFEDVTMKENMDDIIEKLLESPCRVIDILPKQVPAEGGKRYFEFEKYMEKPPFINEIYRKFSAVLMKGILRTC